MSRFDFKLFGMTLLASVIAFFAGEFILQNLGDINDILLMAVYFAVVSLIIGLITNLAAYKISSVKELLPISNALWKSIRFSVSISVAALLLFGALFQYLYSLGSTRFDRIDNYIIAIDNSGSMNDSDPNYKRFDALQTILSSLKQNQTAGVYVFNDSFQEVFPNQKITQELISSFDKTFFPYKYSRGGTDIMLLLSELSGTIADKGLRGSTAVFVISDGQCEIDETVLKNCVTVGLPVHTIGVYEDIATNSLQHISRQTHGVYFNIDSVDKITYAFHGIEKILANRHLVGYRGDQTADSALYRTLRIVFLFLLGLMIRGLHLLIIDVRYLRGSLCTQGILFSLIASVSMEFLIQNTDFKENLVRALMVLLFSIIIVFVKKVSIVTKIDTHSALTIQEAAQRLDNKNNKNKVLGKEKLF